MKFQGIVMLLTVAVVFGREAKEGDKDVNYSGDKVPAYDLPKVLVTAEGERITTAEGWHSLRRPQIMSLFSNLVYGRLPEPSTPLKVTFREVKKDEDFMGGKATRKDVEIQLRTEGVEKWGITSGKEVTRLKRVTGRSLSILPPGI